MLTFGSFGILNLRRPHDRSSRPPGMPSPGEVEAGGLGREEANKKGSPRVEERAAKRGERSHFHSFNDTINDLPCRGLGNIVYYFDCGF